MALALGAAAASAVAAAPAGAAAPSCAHLHGHDLLHRGLVKVVDRPQAGERHRYIACTKPSGRRVRLAASARGARLELLDTQGAKLAVRDARTRAVTVWDVASGAHHRLRYRGRNPLGRVLVTETGAAAALSGTARRVTLVGYDVDGTPYALTSGSIPATSLRHAKGARIRWARRGGVGTADLDAPAVPCATLAGKPVARTPAVNVVSITYASEFLEGAIDGRTTVVRGCALSGGPARVLGESAYATDGVQGGSAYTVLGTAGTLVLGRTEDSDSAGEFTPASIALDDVAGGRHLKLWGNHDAGGPNAALGDPSGTPLATAAGQVASVFVDAEGTGAQVVAFDAAGRPHVLDTGTLAELDPATLTIDGTVLHWTHGSEARSADLAAL